MKKLGIYFLYGGALLFAVALLYFSAVSDDKRKENTSSEQKIAKNQPVKPTEKVQVFLFHNTQRCYSCVAIGKYAKETVKRNFQKEVSAGKIEFREINIDLPENKELANKFKAAGSALFLNAIIDGQDNIKEDTQVWRLVSNEQAFVDYLSDKLGGMLTGSAATQ